MFRRRVPLTYADRVRNLLWPRIGWRRAWRYVFFRVARMPGTAYSVAAGFATGVAFTFTPFVGFHFILAAVFAMVIRANVVAALIGTIAGNPWTFPLIWVWLFELGQRLGAGADLPAGADPDFGDLFGRMLEAALTLDMAYLVDTAGPVLWPMLVGSLVTAPGVWILSYLALQPMVYRFKMRRARHAAEGDAQQIEATE